MGANASEVARLRAEIEAERQAGQRALSGLSAGSSRHKVIEANMARFAVKATLLIKIAGLEDASLFLANIMEEDGTSPPQG